MYSFSSNGHSGDRPAVEPTIDHVFIEEIRAIGDAAKQDFLGELVAEFVNDTDTLLVELRGALEVKDAPGMERIAHKIKGSAGQLGGRRLTSSCARLESTASLGLLAQGQLDLQQVEVDYQTLRRELTQESPSE